MQVEYLNNVNSNEFNYDDLVNYLSQIVLSKTDEEIEKKQFELDKIKASLINKKTEIEALKERNTNLSKELAKEKQLARVLSLVTTLNEEGVIRGKNRAKIDHLLKNIEKLSFFDLRNVEESLSIYIPNKKMF